MKFSYSLIKAMVPKLPAKMRCVGALTMHAFEAEDGTMDTFEVALPPNRYSDAASHVGIARELAAIFNLSLKVPGGTPLPKERRGREYFSVTVEDAERCPRYIARYFEDVKAGPSPAWMQRVLSACGLHPIINVVDIMNYVMLETGQPLHTFDYEKLAGGARKRILIRSAKRGEHITTIDGVDHQLEPEVLVIADERGPLAIAGVKGGRGSEVDGKTVRILVESANFENTGIYRTSKRLNLVTDASTRFSHVIAPALAEVGMARATELLTELTGAKAGECFDSQPKARAKHVLKFNAGAFNRLIGTTVSRDAAAGYLSRLGFREVKRDVWEVPPLRVDVETHEDLAEEVARLMGFDALRAAPPRVALRAAEEDELITEQERVRRVLVGFGIDEVYLPSMVSREEAEAYRASGEPVALQNPTSSEFAYLRPSLAPGLLRSVRENVKYFDAPCLFEVGKVFARGGKSGVAERTSLGIAAGGRGHDIFFGLKGVVTGVCKGMGLTDFRMVPAAKAPPYLGKDSALALESDGKVMGWLGLAGSFKQWHLALCEIDFDMLIELAKGEAEYEPLSRYPSVMRDLSLVVGADARVGDIMQEMQLANPKLIRDVDLIDEYTEAPWKDKQGLTFRVVFQADDRTLSAAEVDVEMKRITALLKRKFDVSVR